MYWIIGYFVGVGVALFINYAFHYNDPEDKWYEEDNH